MSAAPSSPPGAPPGAALTLWLVRHGATAWNEGGQWQGWTDTPLGDLGREQALGLGPVLAAQPFGAAYTSDLRRARQTAELALSGSGLKCDLRTDPRLRELARRVVRDEQGDADGERQRHHEREGGRPERAEDERPHVVQEARGLADEVGSLHYGFAADVLVLDAELQLVETFRKGQLL